MAKELKFGYEGEGPMIGRRTAYASFPAVPVQEAANEANRKNVDSLYFVIETDHLEFVKSLLLADLGLIKVVTIDFPVDSYPAYTRLWYPIRFIRCDHKTDVDIIPACAAGVANTYIKLVCEYDNDFEAFVNKANEIAEMGHTVLLMPDFLVNDPNALGKWMMWAFDRLHTRVRVCPPVHHVLGTP